mgnify:CR=1 FL=1
MDSIRLRSDGTLSLYEVMRYKYLDKGWAVEYADDEQLELTFSTAWSPPEGIIDKLREKYPDLSFSCFYDEPGMEVAGYY